MPKKIEKKKEDEIVKLYKKGYKLLDISKKTSTSTSTVSRVIRRTGNFKDRRFKKQEKCKHDDCTKNASSKGYCSTHYTRFTKYGDSSIINIQGYKDPWRSSLNAAFGKYRSRAEKSHIEFKITVNDFHEISQKPCVYCGVEKSCSVKTGTGKERYYYNTLDRVDSQKGYTKDNIVSSCKNCNIAKNNLSLEEFKQNVKRIYEFLKLNNL